MSVLHVGSYIKIFIFLVGFFNFAFLSILPSFIFPGFQGIEFLRVFLKRSVLTNHSTAQHRQGQATAPRRTAQATQGKSGFLVLKIEKKFSEILISEI